MRGVKVRVRRPVAGEKDALGRERKAYGEPQEVDNVLVGTASTSDSIEADRPDGETVSYTLAFPKSYTEPLRGCIVQIQGDGDWYQVVGDPKPIPGGQLRRPLKWNRLVGVIAQDG